MRRSISALIGSVTATFLAAGASAQNQAAQNQNNLANQARQPANVAGGTGQPGVNNQNGAGNANPNATNQNVAGNQNVNPGNVNGVNQNAAGLATDPNTGALINPNVGAGDQNGELLDRLRNATSNRRELTLTGRIMDVPTFFLGGITNLGSPALQGQMISPGVGAAGNQNNAGVANTTGNQNAARAINQNAAAIPGAANATGNANQVNPAAGAANAVSGTTGNQTQGSQSPGHVNTNQNIAGAVPGATPATGNATVNSANNTGAGSGATGTGLNMAAGSGFGSMFGQVWILATAGGGTLIAQDPSMAGGAGAILQPTATEVTVRGRIFERGGMRLLLVSTVNAVGTENTDVNNSNNGAAPVNPNQLRGNNSGTNNTPNNRRNAR